MTKQNIGSGVTFILTQEEATRYAVAGSEVEYLLGAAGDIFDFLHCSFSLGQIKPESTGVISMIEMVARGFNAAADNEGLAMTQLADKLRAAQPEGRDLT